MPDSIAKFNSEYLGELPIKNIDISEIQHYRKILRDKSLIGILKKGKWTGYNYGNISIKIMSGIIVSSSQTSGMKDVNIDDFTFVVSYDAKSCTAIWCGKKPPSSETPLHWSAYEVSPKIKAVVHGHIIEEDTSYGELHDYFKEKGLPLTQSKSKSNAIGEEVCQLIQKRGTENVIGMDNHDGGFGLLAVDKSFSDACEKILQFYEKLKRF